MMLGPKHSRAGVTLVELLVAVAITVAMLASAGLIFNSATAATGKANATADVMHQYRRLSDQLTSDLRGIITRDMPLFILFESDNTSGTWRRIDRLLFFADGEFEATEGPYTEKASQAQIFYGLSWNRLPVTAQNSESRYVLMRDPKLLINNRTQNLSGDFAPAGNLILPTPISNASPKSNALFMNMYSIYDLSTTYDLGRTYWENLSITDYLENLLLNHSPESVRSLLRRPEFDALLQWEYAFTGSNRSFGFEGLQRRYLLGDVSDFRVQVWIPGNSPSGFANRWFPTESDLVRIRAGLNSSITLPTSQNSRVTWLGLAWNAPDKLSASYIDLGVSFPGFYKAPDSRLAIWGAGYAMQYLFNDSRLGVNPDFNAIAPLPEQSIYPRAIRISYTLYDKDRRHFPEGRSFSTVVELPRPAVQ